jgi:hypothetical protein
MADVTRTTGVFRQSDGDEVYFTDSLFGLFPIDDTVVIVL